MLRSLLARLVVVGALVVADSGALAQGITGSALTGTVKDPEGTPIPEATVQLRNPATGQAFRAVADSAGKYFIDNVPPDNPQRMAFDRLHAWSERFEGAVLLLGLAALYTTVQALR